VLKSWFEPTVSKKAIHILGDRIAVMHSAQAIKSLYYSGQLLVDR
jgi:hypothetical protein